MESGRLAYFGPSAATQTYFASHALVADAGINPVDFYLDIVSKPPVVSTPPKEEGGAVTTWGDVFRGSAQSASYLVVVARTVDRSEPAGSPPQLPSNLSRLAILVSFFTKYYTRDTGFYYLRFAFLVAIALFIGTLFLQLEPNTDNLSKYSGSIFFNIWVRTKSGPKVWAKPLLACFLFSARTTASLNPSAPLPPPSRRRRCLARWPPRACWPPTAARPSSR